MIKIINKSYVVKEDNIHIFPRKCVSSNFFSYQLQNIKIPFSCLVPLIISWCRTD